MPEDYGEIYEFDGFRLDVTEHLLVRCHGNQKVQLSDKAFQTLCVLVRNAGRLVQKSELLDKVWADSFVEENNLNKTIHAVRRALGESNGQQFIETIKKHGFRFVAGVRRLELVETTYPRFESNNGVGKLGDIPDFPRETTIAERVAQTDAVELPATPHLIAQISAERELSPSKFQTEPGHLVKYLLLIVAVAVISMGFIGIYFYAGQDARRGQSIAILPTKPLTTTVRDAIYEVGIADSLIHKISGAKDLAVRPLSATRKYVEIEQDAMLAGKEQQVDYVLASNYQLHDGKIRVTAQLFDVATGQIEGTYKSEHDTANVFGMQDAIAGDIANMLLARFGTGIKSRPSDRGTTNEEAYRLYMDGMYLYDKRTVADATKAVAKLEQATQFDPNYAKAWAGKAHAHRSLGNFGGSLSPHEEYRKSMEALRMALALDENLADAHSALCENKFFYEWDPAGAELECRRAVELDPNSSVAHEIYSRCLLVTGRFDEAISEAKVAIDIEPASLFSQRTYGISLYYARRTPEAIAQFKRVVELDSNFIAIYHWLINALLSNGNEAEASKFLMTSLELQKADQETLLAYQTAYQGSGWAGVGRERVKRFDEDRIRSYFLEASLTAYTGNKDKAFEYLERAFERREWGIPYLQIDPSLDSLRSDPRYDDLVRRVSAR